MGLGDGIRKHGFRKWYERELLQSHAHLVLTVFCAIGILAAFEMLDGRAPPIDQLTDVVAIMVCGAVGIWALRRYLYLLTHAEATAHQAECPHCKTYARFTFVAESRDRQSVEVRCRHCEQRWFISE